MKIKIFVLAMVVWLSAGFLSAEAKPCECEDQDDWQRYSWGTPGREGFTVLMPFVPRQIGDEKSGTDWQGIMADNDGSKLYQLPDKDDSVVFPLKNLITYSVLFRDGVSKEEFDKQVAERMQFVGRGEGEGVGTPKSEIEKEVNLNRQTAEVSVCGYSGIRFGNSNSVQQFFFINNRLYRLTVSGLDRSNPDAVRFLDSFTLINPWQLWKGRRVNEKYEPPGFGSGDLFESSVCQKIGTSKIKNEIFKEKIEKKPTNANLIILSKPRATYPEESKKKQIQGKVSLEVAFLRNGTIGDVSVVKGINKEIDESAVRAAKLIKFEPQRKNGKPVDVKKMVEYNFVLY